MPPLQRWTGLTTATHTLQPHGMLHWANNPQLSKTIQKIRYVIFSVSLFLSEWWVSVMKRHGIWSLQCKRSTCHHLHYPLRPIRQTAPLWTASLGTNPDKHMRKTTGSLIILERPSYLELVVGHSFSNKSSTLVDKIGYLCSPWFMTMRKIIHMTVFHHYGADLVIF